MERFDLQTAGFLSDFSATIQCSRIVWSSTTLSGKFGEVAGSLVGQSLEFLHRLVEKAGGWPVSVASFQHLPLLSCQLSTQTRCSIDSLSLQWYSCKARIHAMVVWFETQTH